MKAQTSTTATIAKQGLNFLGIIYILGISWTTLSSLSQLYRFKMESSIDIFPQKNVLPDAQVKKVIKELHLYPSSITLGRRIIKVIPKID